MGIRFYCPKGHKLNVKAFLAGRRGICPHCGAKVRIPAESTLPASTTDAAGNENGPENPPPPLSIPLEGGEGDMGIGEPTSPPSSPATGAKSAPEDTAAAPAEEPSVVGLDGELTGTLAPSTGDKGAPPRGPEKPTPQSDALPDPLAEAPDAAWYVRPPAGGQFGPANGQAMRQWIEEGRISGDSLVWREGWRDWQEASAALPSVGSSGPIPKIDTGGSPPASHRSGATSSQGENAGPPVPESGKKPTLIVAVLALAVVGLSIALAWVWLR